MPILPALPRLPLSRHQLFHTRDVDEARECVARIFCPHDLSMTRPGTRLDARHHSVPLHRDISLNYVQYGPQVDIEPGYLGNFYLLQIPLRGSALIRGGSQDVMSSTNMASLPSPTEPLSMRWNDDSPHLILRISKTAIQQQFEKLSQAPVQSPLVFKLAVPADTPKALPVFNFVKYLCATLNEDNALGCAQLAAQAEAYLLSSLLMLVDHNHSHTLAAGSRRPLLLRSVRRAQEYLQHNATEALSLADVCQHVGVSARVLQLAFKHDTGQSPMAYLRDVRLDGVREALQRSDHQAKATVSLVAAQFGFLHLGHFAVQYRKRFGELPAQTLVGVR